jgi:hypothetical protein
VLSRSRHALRVFLASASAVLVTACAHPNHLEQSLSPSQVRKQAIRRAQVWIATDVRSMDLKAGPQGKGAFAFDEEVACDFVDRKVTGGTPKFYCRIGADDEVKVKYGRSNGEVYAEVAATRLLWALGFPADAMYPVRVVCRGCPADPFHRRGDKADRTVFEIAATERKYPGKSIGIGDSEGWDWSELEEVDEAAGGARRAERDALKLLAVMIQHTDTKPEQQRIICTDGDRRGIAERGCLSPFMMLNDLGETFGKASLFNSTRLSAMNLQQWSSARVWKDSGSCIGNLPRSYTGTLNNPQISEAGRRFLANLLVQLSDEQLSDLFETAHVTSRAIVDGSQTQTASVGDWVSAFKKKRDEVVNRSCERGRSRRGDSD